MSTRGFLGVKENGKIRGKFTHWDSYYGSKGTEAVNAYFSGIKGGDFINLTDTETAGMEYEEKGNLFLYDGLFCEYGYVYNADNNTLEIYRGFFEKPQVFRKGAKTVDGAKLYCHLVMVIDKKLHNKTLVKKAMEYYLEVTKDDEKNMQNYPERDIINMCEGCLKPLKVGKKFHNKKCKDNILVRAI